MKQTAVELFLKELIKMDYFIGNDMLQAFEQAKEMEKEQIKDAYKFGIADEYVIGAEQYYNQTFKKD
jgi:hypothetical protein